MADETEHGPELDEEALEAWYQRRKQRDERDARKKKLGPDAELMADFIIDRLFDRLEERAREREAATDDPPSRKSGDKPTGILGLLAGNG